MFTKAIKFILILTFDLSLRQIEAIQEETYFVGTEINDVSGLGSDAKMKEVTSLRGGGKVQCAIACASYEGCVSIVYDNNNNCILVGDDTLPGVDVKVKTWPVQAFKKQLQKNATSTPGYGKLMNIYLSNIAKR